MLEAQNSVFAFDSVAAYLASKRTVTFSAWAKRLGCRSPRLVSMVLNGKRPPSTALLDRFARDLALSDSERRYLELLALRDRLRRRRQAVGAVEAELSALRGEHPAPVVMTETAQNILS